MYLKKTFYARWNNGNNTFYTRCYRLCCQKQLVCEAAMTDLIELGQAVKRRRTDLGLSRNQLSEMARVSLARIEGLNRRRPTLEDLQRENSRS